MNLDETLEVQELTNKTLRAARQYGADPMSVLLAVARELDMRRGVGRSRRMRSVTLDEVGAYG